MSTNAGGTGARRALGEFIAHSREALDMTQVSLAEKVDVGSGQVSKWERGLSLPTTRKLARLTAALQVDRAELFERYAAAKEEELTSTQRELSDTRRDFERAAGQMKLFVETYAEFHSEYQRIGTDVDRLNEKVDRIEKAVAELMQVVLSQPPRPHRARP